VLNRSQGEIDLAALGSRRKVEVKPAGIYGERLDAVDFGEVCGDGESILVELLSA
jgi:hypothetical protein